jgi:hypothetical protein
MLRGTSRSAAEVIAVLEPARGSATVAKIAINAVMAGCRPEHFPVVLAAVAAIGDEGFGLRGVAMSTGPHAPLIVCNGPIVDEIGINSGRGALGPSPQSAANVVIGRAVRLVMVNCGYAYLGLFDLDTIGAPRKFSHCLAENERQSPFPPLSVDQGFPAGESTVTVFAVESESECQDMANSDPKGLLRTYAGVAAQSGSSSVQHTYLELAEGRLKLHNMMLMPPEHAKVLADAGWTKHDAIQFVYEQSFREAKWVLNAVKPLAMRPDRQWAAELAPEAKIPSMDGPEVLHIIVVGGVGGKGQYLHGTRPPVTALVAPYLP